MIETPLVSVIIVNYNGGELLLKCIESMLIQTHKNLEIILVDNASQDDSILKVEKKYGDLNNLKIIRLKKNVGFLIGNDIGFLHIHPKSKYILMLNNDAYLERDCLARLVSAMERDESIGAAQPEIYFPDGRVQSLGNMYDTFCMGTLQLGRHIGPEDFHLKKEVYEVTYPCGAVALLRTSLIKRIGFLDPKFFLYHDDIDLGFRIWLSGYRVVTVRGAKAYHYGGYSTGRINVDVYYFSTKSRVSLMLKYYQIWSLLRYLPTFLLLYFIKLLGISIKNRNAKPLIEYFKGLYWIGKNLRYLFRWRRFINTYVRRVSDKELFRVFIRNPFPILLHRFVSE